MRTFLPLGPRVTWTALARASQPSSILARASLPKMRSLAANWNLRDEVRDRARGVTLLFMLRFNYDMRISIIFIHLTIFQKPPHPSISFHPSRYVSYYITMSHPPLLIFLIALAALLLPHPALAHQDCPEGDLTEEGLLAHSLDCFRQKYNSDIHDGNKLVRTIDQRVTEYKKILQHIKLHKMQAVKTSPVIKWAQTKQKIFINFKLSHRQDSPPCSDVRNDHFNITRVGNVSGQPKVIETRDGNQSGFSFEGFCYFTNQKLLFTLELFFSGVLLNLHIEKEGLGSYTLVGDKQVAEIWIDPFPDVQKTAIWAQLREKHAKDMDEYFEMREKRKQQSEGRKGRRRRRKRTQSSPSAAQQKPEQGQEEL